MPGNLSFFCSKARFRPAMNLPKNAAEHFHRQEERLAWANPALMIGPEAAGRDHAVNVGMNLKILPPGVEHTEETDLGAQVLGIGGNL